MKVLTICLNILFLLVFFPSLYVAAMSFMSFDAPGSKTPLTWFVVLSVSILPVVIVIAQVRSWMALLNHDFNFALLWSLAPLANIILIACAWFLLDFLQSGKFTRLN